MIVFQMTCLSFIGIDYTLQKSGKLEGRDDFQKKIYDISHIEN